MKLFELIDQLIDPDRNVRNYAAEPLGQAADIRAAEALCVAIADPDRGIRSSAALALGHVLDNDLITTLNLGGFAVLGLCKALRDKNNEREVRRVAAVALGRTVATNAVPALCSALDDIDVSIYTAAADSMVQIGDASILPLCAALNYTNPSVQTRAEFTLARIRNSTTGLAHRILCSTTLKGEQIIKALQTLNNIPHTLHGSLVHDLPSNLEKFCKDLCRQQGTDESVKRGAEAVLAELERRDNRKVLLRASERSDAVERDELLRVDSRGAFKDEPDILVRPSDKWVGR